MFYILIAMTTNPIRDETYFTSPATGWQRRYEALRASMVERVFPARLGKGRKTRCTPLRPDVVESLQQWFAEQGGTPTAPVFPSSKGGPLSADALQALVGRHAANASRSCPTLARKHVTPHTKKCGIPHSRVCGVIWIMVASPGTRP
jgi:integrase